MNEWAILHDKLNGALYSTVNVRKSNRTCSDFGQDPIVPFKIAPNRQKCLKTERFVRFSDDNLRPKAERLVRSNVKLSDSY